MAEIGESEEAHVGVRDHLDNLAVFAILVTLIVSAMQGVGRLIGKRLDKPGLTAFFGG